MGVVCVRACVCMPQSQMLGADLLHTTSSLAETLLFCLPSCVLTKDNNCTCLQGVRGLRRGTPTAWHIKWPLYRGCPMAIVSSCQEPAALPKSFWNFPGGSSRYLLANVVSVHRDIPWL